MLDRIWGQRTLLHMGVEYQGYQFQDKVIFRITNQNSKRCNTLLLLSPLCSRKQAYCTRTSSLFLLPEARWDNAEVVIKTDATLATGSTVWHSALIESLKHKLKTQVTKRFTGINAPVLWSLYSNYSNFIHVLSFTIYFLSWTDDFVLFFKNK